MGSFACGVRDMASGEFKIVVVGTGGVGKSGLTLQFCAGKCPKRYDPTIEDSYRKQTEVKGRPCTLDILDTAGQDEYASLRVEYMQEGKGFIIVYSVTNAESFEEMDQFFNLIKDSKKPGDAVPICLVGNKIDLDDQRKVTKAQESKDIIGEVTFKETSALTNINVVETFKELVELMLKQRGGGAAPEAAAAKESAPAEGDAAPSPKTTGDKGGGCKCVVS